MYVCLTCLSMTVIMEESARPLRAGVPSSDLPTTQRERERERGDRAREIKPSPQDTHTQREQHTHTREKKYDIRSRTHLSHSWGSVGSLFPPSARQPRGDRPVRHSAPIEQR